MKISIVAGLPASFVAQTRRLFAHRLAAVAPALLVSLALSACGGGGGGSVASGGASGGATIPATTLAAVSGYTPSSGLENTQVTILGSDFKTTAGAYVVKFAGVTAQIVSQTATQLTVVIPNGAKSGLLTVQGSDLAVSSTEDFIVIAGKPTITGISPRTSSVGSVVTIQGDNFSTTAANNEVTVNGTPLEVVSAARTTLTVKVPANVGSGVLNVRIGDATASSSEKFLVFPKIKSFTPASAAQGETVTLTGTNLTRDTYVHFGNSLTRATVVSAIGTEMVVVVPDNAQTGSIFALNPEEAGDLSATSFTVLSKYAPTIARFSPAYGQPGTRITIFGTNFNSNPLQNTVKIGGIKANVIAVSESAVDGPYMWVTVPAMLPGTGYQISVTTAEGAVTTRTGFDIAELPPKTPVSSVKLSADALSFGAVTTGAFPTKSLTVTNTGTVGVKLSGGAVNGAHFRMVGTTCYGYNYQLVYFDTLAPGASCVFDVDFGPTDATASAGALSFTAGATPLTVSLNGSGVLPLVPLPVFTPASLTFESQELGTSSAAKTTRLVNTGTGPLTLDPTTGLVNSGEYRFTHNCPSQLAPGAGCNVNVVFAPVNRAGTKSGTLSLISNYSRTIPVPLTGVGTLAHSGKLAIYTRESWGVQNVFVDGIWSGKLNYDAQDACGGVGAITLTLPPGDHTVDGSDPLLSIQSAKATVTEGACTVFKIVGTQTCKSPNFVSGGFCYPPSVPTCTSTQVLRNGVCVTPGTTSTPGGATTVNGNPPSSGTGGVAGVFDSSGTGVGAAQCLRFGQVTGEAAHYNDSQTITNVCGYEIYVMRCHSPVTANGTKSSECGATYDGAPRFYQQFHWLAPGETNDNGYTMPIGATIWYGACSGGRGSHPSGKAVSITGTYICQ
jgi:hypothetical protein